MMTVALFAGVTIFCLAQAIYWNSRKKQELRAAALLQKLGGELEEKNVSLFKESSDSYQNWALKRLMVALAKPLTFRRLVPNQSCGAYLVASFS